MNQVFESLPQDKKQKIIDACIAEFAANGYDRASTNAIVQNAGISKGALFYYFGSKKDLFLYIFNYSIEKLMKYYYEVKDMQPADAIERLTWYTKLKLKVFLKEPVMSKLIVDTVTNMPEELRVELEDMVRGMYATYLPMMMGNIDDSNFREGVDKKRAVEIISIFIDGYTEKYLKAARKLSYEAVINDLDNIMDEYYKYLEILKYGIYKSPQT